MSVCVFSSAAFNVLSSFKLGKKELICLWIMIFLNGPKKPQCISHKACCKDYSKPVYGHVPLQDSDRRSLACHVDQRPPGIR